MARRAVSFFMTALAFGLVGCNDDTPAPAIDELPQLPQILPNAQEGVIGFPLTLQGDSPTLDAVFVNGGMDDLVISNAAISNDSHGVFSMTMPQSLTVESRHAIGFPVTFTSPGRGIYIGDLVVTSNAANFPSLTLQLVAPGAGLRIPDVADIEPFETTVQVQAVAGLEVPAAMVRLYNLGGSSLEITGYTLSDTTNFRFLKGTALPSTACNILGACVPASPTDKRGCCGVLQCVTESPAVDGVCSPVIVARGRFVLLGVTWTDTAAAGAHTTDLAIASNDPDQSVLTVSVTGTR